VLFHTNEMVTYMHVKEHYDRLIDENNDPFRDPPELQKYMDQWDGQMFLSSLALDLGKTVLEIGIGTGRLANRTAGCCAVLTGIDISPKTIKRAMENLRHHRNIRYICADFLTHDFSKKFDVVYSSLTLMHFEDKKLFFAKVCSLLHPGGRFCLSIDKNQSEYIDMGTRKIRIYPDNLDNTLAVIQSMPMRVTKVLETAFAHIIICTRL